MATFIFVAGAMHGAWTWDRVTPILAQAGHESMAIDLPGMGGDTSVAHADVTLDLWGEHVADIARTAPDPVILVAHSRGGVVIGEAAERAPASIRGLIYVAAIIAPPGLSALEASGLRHDPTLTAGHPASISYPPDLAMSLFYNCCTQADAVWATAKLELEPAGPIATPATVSWERWGQLPRAYIECLQDRALSMARQQAMQAVAPCDPVVRIDTDHSPFFSTPDGLGEALLGIARGWGC